MQKGSHAKTQEGPHAKTQRRKGKSFLVPKEVCVTCLSGMWMAHAVISVSGLHIVRQTASMHLS